MHHVNHRAEEKLCKKCLKRVEFWDLSSVGYYTEVNCTSFHIFQNGFTVSDQPFKDYIILYCITLPNTIQPHKTKKGVFKLFQTMLWGVKDKDWSGLCDQVSLPVISHNLKKMNRLKILTFSGCVWVKLGYFFYFIKGLITFIPNV